ncbi:MAG: YitT family protein [Spartobacteria bacterium]|nr:YitT family protein [Spartobacteria bacterium]
MVKKAAGFLKQIMLLATGSTLCALAVKAFVMPHGFLSRGLTGMALLISYVRPEWSIGPTYFVLNVPVFLLGGYFVGRRFVAYSLLGMAIYSFALAAIDVDLAIADPMLCAVIGGALSGIGVAVLLRSFGSSGGSEIISVVLNKLFGIEVGTGAMLVNAAVLIASALLFPLEKVLYTLVFVFVSSQFANQVFHGLARRRTALIMSEQWQAVAETLTRKHQLGVTLLKGHGGFGGEERHLLYSVVLRRDVSALKRAVNEIDAGAFIAIMDADDVTGLEIGNQPHW